MTTGNDPFGVLLLGFAGLSAEQDHQRDMYLPAFNEHPDFDVVAVADEPGSSSGAQVAATLGVELAPSWEAGLDDPRVDVVSVCCSQARRVEIVTAALRAGKHVVVDKPMALTAGECAQIADVARAEGTVCLPAHHQRMNPMISAAAAAVAAGRVGLPWNVQADFLVAGGVPSDAGELVNLGVYPVDAVLALSRQRVRRVHATTARNWDARPGVEDFALLHLDHDHGVTSTLSVGRLRALADTPVAGLAVHRYRISGSHGVLDVDALRPRLNVRTAKASSGAWYGPDTVRRLLDDLHGAVRAGRPTTPGPDDATQVAEILDAARSSAATGDVVELAASDQ